MEKNIIILKEQEMDYIERDYVAQKIKEAFNVKNLIVNVYSNETWSFYDYRYMILDPMLLMMEGGCFVKNATKECYTEVYKEDDKWSYVILEDFTKINFKLEKLPKKTKEVPRF